MSSNPQTSPKIARCPQARSLPLRSAISEVAEDYDRFTIRQLFYQLVSRGVVEKSERAYKRVCDAAVQMRLAGTLPFSKVVDGHRSRRRVDAWDSARELLDDAAAVYRRDFWSGQSCRVEVWCEKDALTGVIQPVCDTYGVTYVATRGFPSLTLLYESGREMAQAKVLYRVLYFGDHDASGCAIDANLAAELRRHGALVEVARIALEPDQIAAYALPTRLGKTTDTRHRRFVEMFGDSRSVELDALPPDVLTEMLVDSIEEWIDRAAWNRLQRTEKHERETLAKYARAFSTRRRSS